MIIALCAYLYIVGGGFVLIVALNEDDVRWRWKDTLVLVAWPVMLPIVFLAALKPDWFRGIEKW